MERQRGFETRRLVIVVLLFGALAIPLFVMAGCGEQLTRMEENQVKLEAMVAANTRDLATISAQLHTGQGKINESIQTLDGDTQQVAAGVTTVQNEQRQLQEAVAAGHEGLNRRVTQVQDSQSSLQAGVAQVSEVTQRTATDLTALARDQATLHEMVQANQRELTGSLGTVVNNQQRIQTGLGDLHQASQGLAGDIASLATKNDTLYATLQDNSKQLTERLTVLASGHGQLCADITNVHTLLQTMATDLTAASSSLKEQLGVTGEKLTAQITGLSASQQQLQTGLDALGGKAEQTTAALADTKSSLQETLRVSREVLTGQMAASLQNQETLHSDVRDLGDKADKLTANIGEVATEQAALHQTLHANHDTVITAMAGLSDRQETLRGGIDKLDTKTERVAGDVAATATQQQSLYEAVKANQDAVTAKFADVSQRQTTLQSSISGLDGKAEAIASAQNTLRQTLQNHHESVSAGLAGLTDGQQALKGGIANLDLATQRVASNIAQMTAGQDTLRQALKTHGDSTNEQMTALADIHEQIKTNLDTLTATTGQVSLDVLALGNNQAGSTRALQAAVADLGTRTDKVAAELTAVAAGQNSLNDTLNRQGQAASTQMAKIADGQQQMQNSLDTLTATTSQTALDVIAVTSRQDAIQAALQSHSEVFGTQMAQLADGQQQMQSGLDIVTATAGQASLDTLALSNSQDRLGQTVQAGRQEVADKLAAMAQSQQVWSDRLDNAQAKVTTIADNIAALEQQIAKLQTVLQTSLQDTTVLLGTTGQQRLQFETKVSQDVQAVIDSLGQLRQMQTSLQEQITQVQRSTQGQADSLRSVIEQIKATPSVTDRVREQTPAAEDQAGASVPTPPAAEVKVSRAAETPQVPALPDLPEATE